MAETQFSYLDLTVLAPLRRKVLSNEATVLFSADMRHVLWANSRGARLFGGSGVAELIDSALSPRQPFVRQLCDAVAQMEPDEPIVRGFRVASGLRTEFIQCELSRLVLPDGEPAVLLVAMDDRSTKPAREHELAEAAVESLSGFATAAAIIDDYGLSIAATAGFSAIDLSPEDLEDLVGEAAGESDRLVKRMVESVDGTACAVGIARLRERPGRYLLVCVATDLAAEAARPARPLPTEAMPEPETVPEPEIGHAGEPALTFTSDETLAAEPAAPPAGEPEETAGPQEASVLPADRSGAGEPSSDAETGPQRPSVMDRWYSGILDERWAEEAPGAEPEQEPAPASASTAEAATADVVAEAEAELSEPETGESLEPAGAGEPELPVPAEASTDVPEQSTEVAEAEPQDEPETATEVSPDTTSDTTSEVPPGAPPEAPFVFARTGEPVRFAWVIDADQVIRSVSPELARTVGPNAADIVGRKWRDVARVFGFDRSGDIGRLLEKRDTWSGKSVLWPIQGTDLAVPVDLAALPSFSSGRQFDGFRGFGIIRCADAMVDPDETGLALVPGAQPGRGAAESTADDGVEERRMSGAVSRDRQPAEPRGPATGNVVELPSRKRIDARAETRDELSRRESQAFSEIGRTLRSDENRQSPDLRPSPVEAPPADATRPEARSGEVAASAVDENEATGAADAGEPPMTASILAQLPIPVLVYRNGETLFANPELLELTGYRSTAEIADAGGIDTLLSGNDDDDPGHAVLATRDGRRITIHPHLQTVPWHGEKALLLSFRQPSAEGAAPSDQKIALDMARVAELQNILDTATDGIVITGVDGKIDSLNASAEALFGIDSAEAATKPLIELFARESHKTLQDYMTELSEPGVASLLNDGREVIGKEAKGGLIPLFVTIGRVGAAEKYCLVLRDLTQWKKAEEELVNARRAAELASEQKSEFLARVSHEIRTPLNAIIGFSDVMLEERFGPIGNERYRDYLRDINRSGVHVLDLINDLLDISKIEAGKLELTYEAVDLNQLVAETVALLQPQANRERIIIRTSLSRAVPRVVADARSIRQIILNLVSNAIKFTPENGQVIVSTVYEGNGEVALRVRDTGRGMTEAEIETAMKPFHQLRGADERRGRGTGLGLPLTKALVEANRAYFDLESEPGEGTIAHVHFPTQRVLAD